jgi:hypothetical protein
MSKQIEGLRLHGPVQLASADMDCWKCRKGTPVHALVAADVEEFESGEEPMRLESPSFVYEIDPDALPAGLVTALARLAPNFKPTYSRTVRATSWANVCVHCGVLQGAFFLHGEPDGPFFGSPEDFVGRRLVLSSAGFHIGSASYSL